MEKWYTFITPLFTRLNRATWVIPPSINAYRVVAIARICKDILHPLLTTVIWNMLAKVLLMSLLINVALTLTREWNVISLTGSRLLSATLCLRVITSGKVLITGMQLTCYI